MKCKVFSGRDGRLLEKVFNDWVTDDIGIVCVTTNQLTNGNINWAVFYEEQKKELPEKPEEPIEQEVVVDNSLTEQEKTETNL